MSKDVFETKTDAMLCVIEPSLGEWVGDFDCDAIFDDCFEYEEHGFVQKVDEDGYWASCEAHGCHLEWTISLDFATGQIALEAAKYKFLSPFGDGVQETFYEAKEANDVFLYETQDDVMGKAWEVEFECGAKAHKELVYAVTIEVDRWRPTPDGYDLFESQVLDQALFCIDDWQKWRYGEDEPEE